MSPGDAQEAPRVRIASLVAALAFTYALLVTLVLLFATGFFSDEDNQRIILAWLSVPIIATFLGWMSVREATPVLRIAIWFLILATLFFCWISIFSIGVYYLPAPLLMIAAALGPWSGDTASDGGEDS